MNWLLILVAFVIFTCVILNNVSFKIGIPMLLMFILLGLGFGSVGIIDYDDYEGVEKIATFALILIMFYGGFGTSWKAAKTVAVEAGLLASLGVIMTAGITGVLCHYLLHWHWDDSLLLGAVLSSTDAASVFSILRSRKLGLRHNTAPLLEMESGSNDPFSYMLTAVMLSVMAGKASGGAIGLMLFEQLFFGVACGLLIAQGAVYAMKHINFNTSGFDSLFVLAIAIFSYAIPSVIGGNGYLSAYLVGIILGNANFKDKKDIVHFYDGFTGLMQVIIFFMLGLLARPSMLAKAIVPALVVFAIMFLVARPVSVAAILTPFRKYHAKHQAMISFVGLRGASSIVFAIMATVGNEFLDKDIFSIVFCIVLISIALQGSLIPFAAKKLDMIDKHSDVMKTFNDFSEEMDMHFSEVNITPTSPWKDKEVKDFGLPKSILLCLVIHPDGSRIVPNGHTMIREGDKIVLYTRSFSSMDNSLMLIEHKLSENSQWIGRKVREYPSRKKEQLVLIKRGEKKIIPHGDTVLEAGDLLVINRNYTQDQNR